MMQARTHLAYAITRAVVKLAGDMARMGAEIPTEIGIKTTAYYARVLERNTRDLYNGAMAEAAFVDALLDLIDAQLTRAWDEGMRENGLDPKEDMIDEWAEVLEEKKLSELDYVDDFAAEIVQAAKDDKESGSNSLPGLLARADMWANRYTDIVNLAIVTTAGGKDRSVWQFGDTEHCNTCFALNGIVAFASEWLLAAVQPQSPQNDALDCGGWHCQCTLSTTDQRRTRGAFDRIMGALGN